MADIKVTGKLFAKKPDGSFQEIASQLSGENGAGLVELRSAGSAEEIRVELSGVGGLLFRDAELVADGTAYEPETSSADCVGGRYYRPAGEEIEFCFIPAFTGPGESSELLFRCAVVETNPELDGLMDAALRSERKLEKAGTSLKQVKNYFRIKERECVILEEEKEELAEMLDDVQQEYSKVVHSIYWKMTGWVRIIARGVKKLMKSNKATKLFCKGLLSLKRNGVRNTFKRVKIYNKRQEEIGAFLEQTGIDLSENDFVFSPYDAEYEENIDFTGYETDVKTLAFYLPQYHENPQNNEWWGEGFTEWTNTSKARPRFRNHYQPREPHTDIGYYDLSEIETMQKQARLAKQHGIYGFCFYYYWFSGERLLEKPVDLLLKHPEVDLNFCLCWANENWTKAWDGQNRHILMEQKYTESDPVRFIDDIKVYIDDPRYIRVEGKPLIVVYNPGQIPEIHKVFAAWRERARAVGLGEILIWTCQTANNTAERLNICDCIDAEVEFPPHNMWHDIIAVKGLNLYGRAANIFNYRKLVRLLEHKKPGKEKVPLHRTCMMGWDNAARRSKMWTTFYAYSTRSFYRWMRLIIKDARQKFSPDERFIFINAWNEWAEGTYLEPDRKYGYANINMASRALFDLPAERGITVLDAASPVCSGDALAAQPKIAVQIHLFYTDLMDEIIREINKIPYPFDCFISTDTEEKAEMIRSAFQKGCRAAHLRVGVFPNRGRDVAPFLAQLAPVLERYEYLCHIHSKKTKTGDYGDGWRKYLYRHLFGSEEYLRRLFSLFEREPSLGIVFPETYPVLNRQAEWGGNKNGVHHLLRALGSVRPLGDEPVFPVGNMFWARAEAVSELFAHGFNAKDFPEEAGQVNATLAHEIERAWVYIAKNNGYGYRKVFNHCAEKAEAVSKKRMVVYHHYDAQNRISEADLEQIKRIRPLAERFVFVTNSSLGKEELSKVEPYESEVILRENHGYDFAGWKEAVLTTGWEKLRRYDELVLMNNSCYGPEYDLNQVFADMEGESVDFWGITMFPYQPDGSYLNKPCIHPHVQSYFQVYRKSALEHPAFEKFWRELPVSDDFIETVANGETALTHCLETAGLKWSVYVKESEILNSYLACGSVPYHYPYELLLLGSPFVKKKAEQYMDLEQETKLRGMMAQLGRRSGR